MVTILLSSFRNFISELKFTENLAKFVQFVAEPFGQCEHASMMTQ